MTLVNFHQPLLRAFFNELPQPDYAGGRLSANNTPSYNIAKTETGFRLDFAVPGWQKQEISVTLEKNQLTVAGRKQHDEQAAGEKFLRREFASNSFRHSFRLPEGLDFDQTQATLEHGILSVALVRLPEETPAVRTIPVG